MVPQESLLVILINLIDCVPMPAAPTRRSCGRPKVYTDQLFLKALVIMIVRHLHSVDGLLALLAQPTADMSRLRQLLTAVVCWKLCKRSGSRYPVVSR